MTKPKFIRIRVDDSAITARARKAVQRLIAEGHDPIEIARLTDATVVSLIEGADVRLARPQWMALHRHYGISLLWLWTGLGPERTPDMTPELKAMVS